MKRYTANQTVEPGFYMNLRQLAFEMKDEAGPLPGGAGDVYRRVPVLAMLALAPFIGLAFVVFLPFVAFATVAWLGAVKGGELAGHLVRSAARAVKPGWEPALAFLSRGRRNKVEQVGTDEWADRTEKRLDAPVDDRQ